VHRSSPLLGVVTVALLLITGCSVGGVEPFGSASTTPPVPLSSAPAAETSASPSSDPVEATGLPSAHESTTTVATTIAPPVTAASIAAEITAAERGIRDTSLSPESVAEFGRRQQRAYQQLARNTVLQEAVATLIPADVAVAFVFNVGARQAVIDHAAGGPPAEPSPTLPAWTILEPLSVDELLAAYHDAEAATGVPWQYLAAINLVETRMGRIRGDSSAGAQGPMQFLPATWAACCTGDINDPRDAILGAAIYLVSQGAPADMPAALYGYNPNEGYVGAVTAYASNLIADPLAYRGYHAWEVYVGSTAGTVRLDVGYTATTPIDAQDYVRTHPEATG
jgi:hypothetical protein